VTRQAEAAGLVIHRGVFLFSVLLRSILRVGMAVRSGVVPWPTGHRAAVPALEREVLRLERRGHELAGGGRW
jgi:hypothetical protein